MDGDWTRLGKAVKAARNSKGLNQVDLGALAEVKRTVIQTIERGHGFKRITATLRGVERALDWGRGSVELLLAGGEPLPADEPWELLFPGQPQPGSGGQLPFRIARALSEGTTLDTAIVPLTSSADVVVVVQGKSNASPEGILAALRAWEKREGFVERLGEPPDEPGGTPEA
jgi:hypothetical protein